MPRSWAEWRELRRRDVQAEAFDRGLTLFEMRESEVLATRTKRSAELRGMTVAA